MGLTLEQEGLYIRMCMFIAEVGRRVPIVDSEAARMMGVQTRNYRRVLGELLRLGKIKRHHDGYGNDRIEYERGRAQKSIEKTASDREPSTAAEGGTDRKTDPGQSWQDHAPSVVTPAITPNYSRSNGVTTGVAAEIPQQNQCSSIEPEPEPDKRIIVDDAQARVNDLKAVGDRLTDIARPILKNPAAAPGLMNYSTILWWMDKGLDVELDVVPTISAMTSTMAAKEFRVASWEYFTEAIVTAKAKRERPLPVAAALSPTNARQPPNSKPTLAAVFAQMKQSQSGVMT
jgi:hypothetical protein